MQLVKLKVNNDITYKTNSSNITFVSSDVDIISYTKISNFYYIITIRPNSKGIKIIKVYNGNDLVDELIVSCVIALPEEQYNYVDL